MASFEIWAFFFFNLEDKTWMVILLHCSIPNSCKIWSHLFFLPLIWHIIQDLDYSNCPNFLGILEAPLNLLCFRPHHLLPLPSLPAYMLCLGYWIVFCSKTIQSIEHNYLFEALQIVTLRKWQFMLQ